MVLAHSGLSTSPTALLHLKSTRRARAANTGHTLSNISAFKFHYFWEFRQTQTEELRHPLSVEGAPRPQHKQNDANDDRKGHVLSQQRLHSMQQSQEEAEVFTLFYCALSTTGPGFQHCKLRPKALADLPVQVARAGLVLLRLRHKRLRGL